jgi:hypothetical protein
MEAAEEHSIPPPAAVAVVEVFTTTNSLKVSVSSASTSTPISQFYTFLCRCHGRNSNT